MATTTVHAQNVVEVWDSKFFTEYVRENLFKPYMGTNANSVIHVKENLTKKAGDGITVTLVRKLTGDGVTGSTTLEGNEESLVNYGHKIDVTVVRNAVLVNEEEEQKTEINLRNAGRDALKNWAMDKIRDQTIDALTSPVVDGVTKYADATETQKDTWCAANSSRILMGDDLDNWDPDHSVGLATIAAAEKLDTGALSLAKRMAKKPVNNADATPASTASASIRPIRTKGGEEWFVVFVNSLSFRDLKSDAVMTAANREAWVRGKTNPLFRDGDLLWDGMIIREIPEIDTIGLVGASSAAVGVSFLCGAQSIGLAWAQRTQTRTDVRDYGFEHGVAVQEMRGIEKLMYNSVQHGVVTIYSAAAGDT